VAMAKKLAVHLYWKWHQGCDYGQLQRRGDLQQGHHRRWPSSPKVVIAMVLCPSSLVSPGLRKMCTMVRWKSPETRADCCPLFCAPALTRLCDSKH
jgi:hypothetical protein